MRATTSAFGSVDVLVRTLRAEFPELDPQRLKTAVERAIAKAKSAQLNTEAHRFIDLHLGLAEASNESRERAEILRDLSENLEDERGDADRALVVRLAAFGEKPEAEDLDPLLRLARLTDRTGELPLEHMLALVDSTADGSARRLHELAAAWQQQRDPYRAADCLERVLAIDPADEAAHEALEVFYRSTGEWSMLVELLGRRAVQLDGDAPRAELFRELGVIYERELGDDGGALEAYQEADRLAPDHPDVLDAIARLVRRTGGSDGEALTSLERLARLVPDPKQRAHVQLRVAEIAKLHDYDKAQAAYERARADDPDLVPAIDGLAILLRDRGELAALIQLLVTAADRPALAAERSRWLTDAADFCVAIGDTDWAKGLYRDARAADPANYKAGVALVELCWDSGEPDELVPILDELCRTTTDPSRLRGYLAQRADLAAQHGDAAGRLAALERAFQLDPHDPSVRRQLADLAFERQDWARARDLIDGLLDDREDLLQRETSIELHYRLARCARELGDDANAEKHAAVTLALQPDHRPALLLRAELDIHDPDLLLADQLALANTAPAEEKGPRFAALGDRYAELGDPATAREMYREALAHRPDDHLLLTKFLGLVADDGDWSYSLDLVQRLIDTEQDPKVRARYRHLAAMIARDELDRPDQALALLGQALEDAPALFTAADELEAMLATAGDRDGLAAFYYRRLGHVRDDEGRRGERLRLWDKLGEVCLALGRRDDALTAFGVALTLAPDEPARRERLADLYAGADPKHDADAIALHQRVLRASKRRVASYEALRTLYKRGDQPEKARACDEALAIVGRHLIDARIDALFDRALGSDADGATRALSAEDWMLLSRLDVDLQLSALFALVAPAFAADRAKTRPPPPLPSAAPDLPPRIARLLAQVAGVFGVAVPPVVLEPDQPQACALVLRVRDGVAGPALALGKPALDESIDDHELAFELARQLADLRTERTARLLCGRPGELAHILELALADDASPSARWLDTALPAVEREQVRTVSAKLRERAGHLEPDALRAWAARAANDWLAATARAGDRIAFVVVGDLAKCVRVLEREQDAASRALELVWSSVTEEVLAVRGRVENWVEEADVIGVESQA